MNEHVTVESEPEFDPRKIYKIVLKGEAGELTINSDEITDDNTYRAIFQLGLDTLCAKANGAAKSLAGITKLEGKELEDRKAEVLKAAEKTLAQLRDGIVPGAKKAKASGAEQTEAMRLAKNMFKDLIRSSGQKVGAYSAKEHTAAAKIILERNPHLMELARKNLAERVSEAKGTKGLDLFALVGDKANSDEVKAKPKVPPKKKGDKAPLSAKQAGMAAPRQKPAAGHTAH
jgi:hypothetical protein